MQFIGLFGGGGSRVASKLEVFLIAVVLLCLPLFEAPKNAFSVLFLIAWSGYALHGRGFGRASLFDLPIAGLAALLWIAPLFSEFRETITPLNSAPRWTLLALFVLTTMRLDYTRGQFAILLAALMVGGAAAVVESFWTWNVNGKPYPELRSVGHVNHSSMYSLILLAAGIGALYMRERWLKAIGIVAIVSTLAFLAPSKSLVGGVAITAILMVSSGIWASHRWSRLGCVLAICSVVIVVAAVLMAPPAEGFRTEVVSRITGDDVFSQRDKILNAALAVWDRHPLIGTGWSSFELATSEEEVRSALARVGLEYDPAAYAHHAHGHNLWTTMLVERGLIGLGLVMALMTLYFWTFLPLALRNDQLDPSEIGAANAALLVALGFAVAGFGNTTMMNEHGHSGMALIAVCYGYLRGRGVVGKTLGA